jgi:hypothetical protein
LEKVGDPLSELAAFVEEVSSAAEPDRKRRRGYTAQDKK